MEPNEPSPTVSSLTPGRPVGRGTLQRLLLSERSRSSRRLLLVAGGLLAVCGVLAWLLWRQSGAQAASLGELSRLQDELHRQELAAADTAELRRKLSEVEGRLAEAAAATDWSAVTRRQEGAIFLCLGLDPKSKAATIGTAFVIDAEKRILVTNAHVAVETARMPMGRLVQAGTGEHYGIEEMKPHPRWEGGKGPDLALLRIRQEAAGRIMAMPLATPERLRALAPGLQVGTLGFPAELAARYLAAGDGERLPGALPTFKVGWIGRLTGLDGNPAEAPAARLVQHSASLSKGTSGSPLFDASGAVVAISFAGLGSRTGSQGAGEMSTAQIGFAVRADEIAELRASLGW